MKVIRSIQWIPSQTRCPPPASDRLKVQSRSPCAGQMRVWSAITAPRSA